MIMLRSSISSLLQTRITIYFHSINPLKPTIAFGPFNSFISKRWKKPADTAITRLHNRTRVSKLDHLASRLRKLRIILNIHNIMSKRRRGPRSYVSLQIMARWKNIVGLNVDMGAFVHKYPHVFNVFTHPARKNLCCRMSYKLKDLMGEEERAIRECETESVRRLKKLLMMSKNGSLHVHALRLIRRELGLPADFRESILGKYKDDFHLVDLEIVELVDRNEDLGVADIEKWREKENTESWLSEFETKFAFLITFPTGFKIEAGFRQKMKNWQRLPYVKPYERKEVIRARTAGGEERYEKRAVALIHELLSLTVERMVLLERLAHFRKDFGMKVNIRELVLKHPGIFYVSTKGSTLSVFLIEAYSKGCLIEPNPIYVTRRKMLDLLLLGRRNTRELPNQEEIKTENYNPSSDSNAGNEHADQGGIDVSPSRASLLAKWTN